MHSATLTRLARFLLLALSLAVLAPAPCVAAEDPWADLKIRLHKDGFDRDQLDKAFAHEDMAYTPEFMARKMNTLLRIKMGVVEHKPKPDKKSKGPPVLDHFLTPDALDKARTYMAEHPDLLASIQQEYGVPPEIMTAFLLVETGFGANLGRRSAMAVLASMAASGDYDAIRQHIDPPRQLTPKFKRYLKKRTLQKSNWAYEELKALLKYSKQLNIQPGDIPGSLYGAIGICQFMPTSALAYGADGDDDGRVDLFNKKDAVHSMANFLKKRGWRPNMTHTRQRKIIYRYNHSWRYTNTIMAVAEKLEE
jgi:membrane-bound lytic murein transglycosylase B